MPKPARIVFVDFVEIVRKTDSQIRSQSSNVRPIVVEATKASGRALFRLLVATLVEHSDLKEFVAWIHGREWTGEEQMPKGR
jgi:hypothetical protein